MLCICDHKRQSMFFMVMIAVETDKICGKAHGYKGMCIAAVLALLCKYHSVHKVSIALSVIEIIYVHSIVEDNGYESGYVYKEMVPKCSPQYENDMHAITTCSNITTHKVMFVRWIVDIKIIWRTSAC